jgi:hypothetical protein
MLRLLRNTRSLVLAAAAVTLAACADDPMAPGPDLAFSGGKLPSAAKVKLLKRTPPLKTVETKSLTITATKGGTISLPTAGLTVTVPVGAVPAGTSLTITVRAIAGKSVGYDFEPHGTVFLKSLTLKQDLAKTSWKQMGAGTLWGGYFPVNSALDDVNSLANITETFPVRITTEGTKKTPFAIWDVWHFSGYVLTTGRADGEADATLSM